jgi:hypothetical protein
VNDAVDEDNTTSALAAKGITIAAQSIVVTSATTGQTITVNLNATTGAASVISSVPKGADTLSSTVDIGTPGSGTKVTGSVVQTYSGTGTQQSGTATAKSEAACAGGNCATEGTLQGLKGVTESIRDTLNPSSITTDEKNLKAQKDTLDAQSAARETALTTNTNKTNLGFGLSITWPTSSCSDPTFAIPGGKGNLVLPMCSKRADLQSVTNWWVSILTAFALFGIGINAVSRKG